MTSALSIVNLDRGEGDDQHKVNWVQWSCTS